MTSLPLMLLIYSKCVEFKNSNLNFFEKIKKSGKIYKKTGTNSEQIGEEIF
jgi:hypothetical protein